MKKLSKNLIGRTLRADLPPWPFLRLGRSGTIVLGYHGIAADKAIRDPWIQRSQIPTSEFRTQLEFLVRHFEPVSADEVLDSTSKKRQVHLTFDDGYEGFASEAVPLLNKYGIPASVFAVTEALSNGTRLPPYIGRAAMAHCDPGPLSLDSIGYQTSVSDRASRISAASHISVILKTGRSSEVSALVKELIQLLPSDQWSEVNSLYSTDDLMSWDTLKKVADEGFTVGAHTKNHLSLSDQQSAVDIENEVVGSIDSVRDVLGKCEWFAYPNGTSDDWSDAAATAVERSGVRGAWTLEKGVVRQPENLNHYRLPRFFVPRSIDRFRLLMNTALLVN